MGQRSRKKGQRTRVPAAAPAAGPRAKPAPTPLPTEPAPGMSRSQRRDAVARGGLEPLSPQERPWPIVAAAVIAATLGIANFILYATGVRPRHIKPHLAEILVFTALMTMCAVGMWRLRYWAVLGFQTLVLIGLLGFSLALIKASSILVALGCAALIGGFGFLFWKLVRVLGRIQMPTYPTRDQ
ncbi:MAG: hypothetical protein ACYDHH_14605 [Solirubrobacteraceae bacterium]